MPVANLNSFLPHHFHSLRPGIVSSRLASRSGFTLVELLVTIAIIAILASLLLPSLTRAKEKAKVIKVHVELNNIGLALHMYADDHSGRLPPVRENCNSDLSEHWCQLPVELAEARYLPRSDAGGREASMEDPFDLGHTYKYAAPGPLILNGEPAGDYSLWVPTNFPALKFRTLLLQTFRKPGSLGGLEPRSQAQKCKIQEQPRAYERTHLVHSRRQ